jgi:hypothetical protein
MKDKISFTAVILALGAAVSLVGGTEVYEITEERTVTRLESCREYVGRLEQAIDDTTIKIHTGRATYWLQRDGAFMRSDLLGDSKITREEYLKVKNHYLEP